MDNKKIGEFISALRKKRNLTQKDLAEILGITDKAISKWERGAGYPDISMLRPLADALGTTVNELLEGEDLESHMAIQKDDLNNALDYADKIITYKENKLGKRLAALFTISLFIAVFTCLIVNVAVNHNLTWSLLVIDGCIMGGGIFLPPLIYKRRGLMYSLCFLTVFIIPFLAVIQKIAFDYGVPSGWLWSIGFPVSLVWLIFIWLMLLLYRMRRFNLWFYICIGALLCIPGYLITNYVVDLYTGFETSEISRKISNTSSIISFLAIAGICLIIGIYRRKPSTETIIK